MSRVAAYWYAEAYRCAQVARKRASGLRRLRGRPKPNADAVERCLQASLTRWLAEAFAARERARAALGGPPCSS